jgi:hypothetical protein
LGARRGSAALYGNAEELNSFQRQLLLKLVEFDLTGNLTPQEMQGLVQTYEQIKKGCHYNHAPIDDWHVKAVLRFAPEFTDQNNRPRVKMLEAIRIRLAWNLSAISYFGLLWLIVFVFVFLPITFPLLLQTSETSR